MDVNTGQDLAVLAKMKEHDMNQNKLELEQMKQQVLV
jgi:hypothetical protein